MKRKPNHEEAITRDGQDIRKAFVTYRKKISPTGHFVLQPRSDVVSVWNKAGRMALMFGLSADEFVAIVFEGVSLTKQFGLMPNSLCGKFAAVQVLEKYGVKGDLDKEGFPMPSSAGDVVRKVMGLRAAKLSQLSDPTNELPSDMPLSGWFASLWTSMRALNQAMFDKSRTMDPEFNKKMFTVENGLYPMSAKAILAADSPADLRLPLWKAYAEELVSDDLRPWHMLKTIQDVRVKRFVAWAKIHKYGKLR